MIVRNLAVKNWRNFQHINVSLRDRQFIVGPNASGKSNLLDIFRFLRDIAKPEEVVCKRPLRTVEECRKYAALLLGVILISL
ncbi:MAG: AAA family ATPase [Syntrophobacteraceae bacterium]|nr:AAA family ATPase [Syntrophobacteraceae bacterium]